MDQPLKKLSGFLFFSVHSGTFFVLCLNVSACPWLGRAGEPVLPSLVVGGSIWERLKCQNRGSDTKIAETPVGSPLPAPPIGNVNDPNYIEVAESRFCHPLPTCPDGRWKRGKREPVECGPIISLWSPGRLSVMSCRRMSGHYGIPVALAASTTWRASLGLWGPLGLL